MIRPLFIITTLSALTLVQACCSSNNAGKAGTSVFERKGEIPTEVAGMVFGMSPAQVKEACETAGFGVMETVTEYHNVGPVPTLVCEGMPAAAPLGEWNQLSVLFCEDEACIIKLEGDDGASFESLRDQLNDEYGPFRANQSIIPSECRGDALTDCLVQQKAIELLIWTWVEGVPGKIIAMVRLFHTGSEAGERVFLYYVDRAGSDLIERTAR